MDSVGFVGVWTAGGRQRRTSPQLGGRCGLRAQRVYMAASPDVSSWLSKLEPVKRDNSLEKPGAELRGQPNLSNDLLLAIVRGEVEDQTVNDIMWCLLGYVKNPDGSWNCDAVPDEWRTDYPSPPDFIGVSREYSPETDRPIKKAVQKLTRSIPKEYKQLLKTEVGFEGFKVNELTPNRTRRATVANWIAYYRTSL